jgi:long-chain acyl-CoA synthetase
MTWCKDKPWMKIVEEAGLIYDLDYPEIPLYELIDRAAREFPEAIAVVYLGKEYTYSELKDFTDRLATALAGFGIKKGDAISVHLVNSLQFVVGVYGGLKAGAVVDLPSPMLSKEDLKDQLQRSGARVIITDEKNLDVVKSMIDETDLEKIILTKVSDYSAEEEPVKEIEGAIQLRTLLDATEPNPPKVEIDPKNDAAILFFTGGATGLPKAPMLTHYNLSSNVLQTFAPASIGLLESNKGNYSVVGALPFFHSFGFTCAMNLALFWAGKLLIVPNPRDVELTFNLIKKYRPMWTPGVPTQFMKMVEEKGLDLTEIQGTIPFSGAAALPPEVSKKFEKKSGIMLSEGYGLSETSPVTHANYVAILQGLGLDYGLPAKIGSIGIPVPETEVEIVDLDTEEPVPMGKTGEMIIRGKQLMIGYWPNPGEGLKDGWLYTGDVVRMDEDGYFYVVDRTKDMINVSGYKVYGRVLDDILYEHPAVSQVAVIGIPDPERPGSERVKAFITPREGYYPGKELEEEIIRFCREKLPPYAVPKSVEFRDELPLTVTEKIFKRKLRDEEIAKMEKEGILKGKTGEVREAQA